jgi:hypothetical protein
MSEKADNSDPRDYILDLSSAPAPTTPIQNSEFAIQNSSPKMPHLSIHFKCCNIYAPLYKNAAATAYSGHCPRCQRPLTIPISPTGTTARIFQAG